MSEWIYFIHPPREDFAATMTDEDHGPSGASISTPFEPMLAEVGHPSGRCAGIANGIAIFEAPDGGAPPVVISGAP